MDTLAPNPIRCVGIAGAGTIGLGLAVFLPQHGCQVIVWARRNAAAAAARCGEMARSLVSRGVIPKRTAREITEKISAADCWEDMAGCDLIVECVAEDRSAKHAVLGCISAACSDRALLASTTSSLRISDLAGSVRLPGRFVGLHFFNPVARMALVEVVPGELTSGETVDRAVRFVESLGKVPLLSHDVAGFVANRLALEMCNRAVAMLEADLASVAALDTAMRLGCGHPTGPLELGDTIGWDTVLACLENLYEATGDPAYQPRPLVRRLVRQGWLGRKVGRGIYEYDAAGGRRLRPAANLPGMGLEAGRR